MLIDLRHKDRWFDAKNIQPRYAFGHGLSYTSFVYENLRITKLQDLKAADTPAVTADEMQHPFLAGGAAAKQSFSDNLFEEVAIVQLVIKNTGDVAGHEVLQLYLEYPEAAGEPPKVLRDFERVHLESGKSSSVSLKLRRKDLSIW